MIDGVPISFGDLLKVTDPAGAYSDLDLHTCNSSSTLAAYRHIWNNDNIKMPNTL